MEAFDALDFVRDNSVWRQHRSVCRLVDIQPDHFYLISLSSFPHCLQVWHSQWWNRKNAVQLYYMTIITLLGLHLLLGNIILFCKCHIQGCILLSPGNRMSDSCPFTSNNLHQKGHLLSLAQLSRLQQFSWKWSHLQAHGFNNEVNFLYLNFGDWLCLSYFYFLCFAFHWTQHSQLAKRGDSPTVFSITVASPWI